MNKVLFVAPTKYMYPINEDLKSKFFTLSEICKPFIFAFSDKKQTIVLGNTNLILHKKLKNRLFNYLKIIYLFVFIFAGDFCSTCNFSELLYPVFSD